MGGRELLSRARLTARMAGIIVGPMAVPLAAGAGPPQPVAESVAPQKIEFHLPSQLIGDALTAVGEQSGLSIAVSSILTKGLKSSPLDGRYTPTEALLRILADTGLRAEFLDSKTVVIVAAAADAQPSVKRPPPGRKPVIDSPEQPASKPQSP